MNKKKVCRIFLRTVSCSVTVAIMIAIFSFSAETADNSQKTSESFTERVLSVFHAFGGLPPEKKTQIIKGIQSVVRKLAHFSIYALLGTFMYLSFFVLELKKPLFAFACCVLYAISDELHQMFIPGRSCELRDMCIDSLGALLGVTFVMLIIMLVKRLLRKKQNG